MYNTPPVIPYEDEINHQWNEAYRLHSMLYYCIALNAFMSEGPLQMSKL
jgi:hypothetical protein